MSTPTSDRDLVFELVCVNQQLTRYGDYVESEKLMDLLWVITDINDDMANGRSIRCIIENVDKAKGILNKIVDSQ